MRPWLAGMRGRHENPCRVVALRFTRLLAVLAPRPCTVEPGKAGLVFPLSTGKTPVHGGLVQTPSIFHKTKNTP